jgi:hypothetical protein
MAHIHFTGTLKAKAEEDAYSRHKSFYVRLTDAQEARAYLPARDAGHAQRIAAAINDEAREAGEAEGTPSLLLAAVS